MDRWLWRSVLMVCVLAARPAILSAQPRSLTLQLPTFRFISIPTTVEVPDQGDALLGGVNQAASGRVERGVPGLGFVPGLGNRATGSTRSAGGMSVTAQIHDFEAMDRALLGDGFGGGATAAPAASLATDASGGTSIAEIRRKQADEDAAAKRELTQLFQQAQQLQTAGKPGVARIYFQTVARRATGPLRDQALAALRSLGESAKP